MADLKEAAAADSKSPGFGMKLTISGISAKFPSVKNIGTHTFAAWHRVLTTTTKDTTNTDRAEQTSDIPKKLIILDSRPDEEFRVGHIPESVRVDYGSDVSSILTAAPELNDAGGNTAVICYCSVGYRSSIVAQKLQQHYHGKGPEVPKVYNLEGSIFKWANEGRPMVDENDRTTKYTHPYNSVFGKLLNKELRKTDIENSNFKL